MVQGVALRLLGVSPEAAVKPGAASAVMLSVGVNGSSRIDSLGGGVDGKG